MPKMIYICILLIYFKVISKKGGHYCPRLPYGRQINKNFKLIFLSIFLLHHTGNVNRIHILFEF